jgi:ribosomal protein S17E
MEEYVIRLISKEAPHEVEREFTENFDTVGINSNKKKLDSVASIINKRMDNAFYPEITKI